MQELSWLLSTCDFSLQLSVVSVCLLQECSSNNHCPWTQRIWDLCFQSAHLITDQFAGPQIIDQQQSFSHPERMLEVTELAIILKWKFKQKITHYLVKSLKLSFSLDPPRYPSILSVHIHCQKSKQAV